MARTGPNGVVTARATFDVSNSATLSDIVDISPGRLVMVRFPNLWTAANITFRVGTGQSGDNDDMGTLYGVGGSEVTLTGGPGRWVAIENPNLFVGVGLVQIRSGTSVATVDQVDDGMFTLIAQRLYTG